MCSNSSIPQYPIYTALDLSKDIASPLFTIEREDLICLPLWTAPELAKASNPNLDEKNIHKLNNNEDLLTALAQARAANVNYVLFDATDHKKPVSITSIKASIVALATKQLQYKDCKSIDSHLEDSEKLTNTIVGLALVAWSAATLYRGLSLLMATSAPPAYNLGLAAGMIVMAFTGWLGLSLFARTKKQIRPDDPPSAPDRGWHWRVISLTTAIAGPVLAVTSASIAFDSRHPESTNILLVAAGTGTIFGVWGVRAMIRYR